MFKNDCFKGWYFKCSAKDKTIAFIAACHTYERKKTASLQIITDDEVFNISFDSLEYCEKPLCVKMGNCIFSEKGIELSIKCDKLTAGGKLRFGKISPVRYDIMGPFRFVPFMQCRHSVYSMKHTIEGQIEINGRRFDFSGGIGYIEGDSGRSFPEKYVWTQCCFKNGSLMLSAADIPLAGVHFNGIIAIVMIDGKEYRIATYLGAKLSRIGENAVTVKQGGYELCAKLIEKNPKPLYAPVNGRMNRTIRESASCKAYYSFSCNGKLLCSFTSGRASFEFEY